MHHWTDQKIRVHVFYSVLALTVAHLMRRQADRAGLHMSVRELLAELAGIGETVLLYHDGGKGRPRARRMLTDTTPTQQHLAEIFHLSYPRSQRVVVLQWARAAGAGVRGRGRRGHWSRAVPSRRPLR